MTKEQENYLERLQTAPNHVLLDMYVEAQVPDDYDGGFSTKGAWQQVQAARAFYARLVSTGWITQEELKISGVENWL